MTKEQNDNNILSVQKDRSSWYLLNLLVSPLFAVLVTWTGIRPTLAKGRGFGGPNWKPQTTCSSVGFQQ
ncbi:MAG: hypothetical protein NVSMB27_41260 [Ktedonobacteraceae bacterium]